jgi:hypothetical protein
MNSLEARFQNRFLDLTRTSLCSSPISISSRFCSRHASLIQKTAALSISFPFLSFHFFLPTRYLFHFLRRSRITPLYDTIRYHTMPNPLAWPPFPISLDCNTVGTTPVSSNRTEPDNPRFFLVWRHGSAAAVVARQFSALDTPADICSCL